MRMGEGAKNELHHSSRVVQTQPRNVHHRTIILLVTSTYIISLFSFFVSFDIPRQRHLSTLVSRPAGSNNIASQSERLQQPQRQPHREGQLYVTPTNDNTVITLIAMGISPNLYLTERCVRSIRARGNFTGFVMIFTDDRGFQQYNQTLSPLDNKVILVKGRPEDVRPKQANGTPVQYSKHTMKFKRYKTLSTKYLQVDTRLVSTIRYILYLDIDNVVSNPLSSFFADYQSKINRAYAQAGVKELSGHSLISFWVDPSHNRRDPMMLQGGQFMVERYHGQGCLDAWRNEMDTVLSDLDQPLVERVAEQFDRYHCLVSLLPDEPKGKHFNLLQEDIIAMDEPEQYPTIVHITGHRAKLFSESQQRSFLKKALDLETEADNIMVRGVRWEDVMEPIGVKGQRPKQW